MKNSIFFQGKSKYWICGFEYTHYLEFKEYINNNPKNLYITYYNYFSHIENDILFMFCRSNKKTIKKGGFFGYCILKGESQINKKNDVNIKVFKDDLVNRCYSEIKDINFIPIDNIISLDDTFENISQSRSFYRKYIKKFLTLENIPKEIGEKIYEKILDKIEKLEVDEKHSIISNNDESDKKSYKSIDTSDEESDKDNEDEESDKDNKDEESDDNKSGEENVEICEEEQNDIINNKNGLVPIMIELCNKFKLPNIKYDKKKYNAHNNPDIESKCKYLSEHIMKCQNCNIINNNKLELGYILKESKMSFKEFSDNNAELEDAIDRYQCCKKFDGFGYDLDQIHIKINYISDEDNLYNKCFLLYVTLPP